MTEADKIKHLLRGVEDDYFEILLAEDAPTISYIVNLCQTFGELRRQRALTR